MTAKNTFTVLITMNQPKSYHSINSPEKLEAALSRALEILCWEGECPRTWVISVLPGDWTEPDQKVVPSATLDGLKQWASDADKLSEAKEVHKALRDQPAKV